MKTITTFSTCDGISYTLSEDEDDGEFIITDSEGFYKRLPQGITEDDALSVFYQFNPRYHQ